MPNGYIETEKGGHLVQGHVDCIGQISDIKERNNSWIFSIVFPEAFSKYIVSVGSIAVDGVSLTIARLEKNRMDISIIPHTMENTIFKLYKQNNYVNLEFDIIGKYVEGLINKKSGDVITLNEQSLRKLGF
ncbi:MAG: hypothetical protein HY800_03035 [Ignavibacteriales bacterium]|nr:hypothetical protein [Ignavibacteriales bacterium]